MLSFSRISTRIGVVFAGLFAGTLLVLFTIGAAVVSSRVTVMVGEQMMASGDIFARLLSDRGEALLEDADLKVKDFGFRSAVTSGDTPTIGSALDTLRQRMDLDAVAMIDDFGDPIAAAGAPLPAELFERAQAQAWSQAGLMQAPGVVSSADAVFLAGVVPVRAPNLVGYVLFGERIDQAEMADLEALAPIALTASIGDPMERATVFGQAEVIDQTVTLSLPTPSLLGARSAVLTLRYPLATALAPFTGLVAILVIASLLSLIVISYASLVVARRMAKPISALVDAADGIAKGETATVPVTGRDELAKLSSTFNRMSHVIRQREEEISQSARIDHETGLPNRLAMEEAVAAANPSAHPVFVIAVGVERFGPIRTTIGFENAGALMRQVGDRLTEQTGVRSVSVIASGVFGALVEGVDNATAEAALHRIQAALSATVSVKETTVDVDVSIGVSRLCGQADHGYLTQALIAREAAQDTYADIAFFDAETYRSVNNNLSLMGDLTKAIRNGDLDVHFQPKYDLRTGLPVGAEALVRWFDPVRGQIFPDAFIPLAEETGRILGLTHFVLERSLEAQRVLQDAGFDIGMAINISGRLVGNEAFTRDALETVRNAAGDVCFEITETAMIEDPENGIGALNRIVEAGVAVSIDDYGSGLSSLAYLKRLPATELKIDKAFVLEIEKSQRDAMLVRSTIDLAHNLGMKVIAEGVETDVAAALLASMGCDYGQGFGLGRPMPLQNLIEHFSSHKDLSAIPNGDKQSVG